MAIIRRIDTNSDEAIDLAEWNVFMSEAVIHPYEPYRHIPYDHSRVNYTRHCLKRDGGLYGPEVDSKNVPEWLKVLAWAPKEDKKPEAAKPAETKPAEAKADDKDVAPKEHHVYYAGHWADHYYQPYYRLHPADRYCADRYYADRYYDDRYYADRYYADRYYVSDRYYAHRSPYYSHHDYGYYRYCY